MAYQTTGLPIDWTNGAGTLPSGGIAIPANPYRKWLYIVTTAATSLTVTLQGVKGSDGVTTTTAALILPTGVVFDRTLSGFVPLGAVTVAGTTGQAVTVLEG